MNIRKGIWIFISVFVLSFHFSATAEGLSSKKRELLDQYSPISETDIKNAASAYGYYLGRNWLEIELEKKFPEYKDQLYLARNKVANTPYGIGAENLEKFLQATFPEIILDGKRNLPKILEKHRNFINLERLRWLLEMYNSGKYCDANNEELCNRFLDFNPHLFSRPELYFEEGLVKRVLSGGHPKSQGINLQFEVPKSWKQLEGRRPHVFSRFLTHGSNGTVIQFIVTISEENPELQALWKHTNPKDILYDPEVIQGITEDLGKVLSVKKTVLDGSPALLVRSQKQAERMGTQLFVETYSFVILYNGRFILLGATVGGDPNDSAVVSKEFNRYEKLFWLIFNSVVIRSKYQ